MVQISKSIGGVGFGNPATGSESFNNLTARTEVSVAPQPAAVRSDDDRWARAADQNERLTPEERRDLRSVAELTRRRMMQEGVARRLLAEPSFQEQMENLRRLADGRNQDSN